MDTNAHSGEDEILNHLRSLESRIARIEEQLNLEPLTETGTLETPVQDRPVAESTGEQLEFRIGQAWFAKIGITVLAIGIAFLLTFPYQNLPPVLPVLFGYVLVAGIAGLSHYWRNSYGLVSRYLLGGAMLLLYFTTLRLHFFSPVPVLTDKSILLIPLLGVVSLNLFVAIRRRSIYLTGLSLALGYATAIVSNQSVFIFLMITVLSSMVVYFRLAYQWNILLFFGMVLSYVTHFLWAVNNPFMGNELHLVVSPSFNLFFVLLYVFIFALGDFLRSKETPEGLRNLMSSMVNGLGGYGLFLFLTLASFKDGFVYYHIGASLLFLALAAMFWIREKSRYATFVYAMLGYFALSVAIVDQFQIPANFLWLSWQTILVISTARWFRSRFIIVANFIIYVIVFCGFLILGGPAGIVSLSFGAIALLSARILNWQKHRLELRTEMMRNAYLACAFFVFPYSLYHVAPGGYVSLSWVCLAVFYYIASLILKSHKYRWMALLTLSITVVYVFLFDIVKLEPAFRIVSFLVLGVVLVAISLIYSKTRSKSKSDEALKTP